VAARVRIPLGVLFAGRARSVASGAARQRLSKRQLPVPLDVVEARCPMGVVPRTDDSRSVPLDEMRLRGPADVVAWAGHDHTIGWRTWPEVWHLDDHGAFHCGYSGSSLESARTWGHDPSPLLRSWRERSASEEGCTRQWLVVDSRQRWCCDGQPVSEADARAYDLIADALATVGVRLLDLMIFDDDCHWWSLGQLLAGHGCENPDEAWPDVTRARGANASSLRRANTTDRLCD
jgi:hypothetical protein